MGESEGERFEAVEAIDCGGEALDDGRADIHGLHLRLVERAPNGECPGGVRVKEALSISEPGLIEAGDPSARLI